MFSKVLDFLKGHYKTILISLGGLFLLYWVVFILTPRVGMDPSEKAKIDSLNNIIKEIYKDNKNWIVRFQVIMKRLMRLTTTLIK
jgi:hypothetical protein